MPMIFHNTLSTYTCTILTSVPIVPLVEQDVRQEGIALVRTHAARPEFGHMD